MFSLKYLEIYDRTSPKSLIYENNLLKFKTDH